MASNPSDLDRTAVHLADMWQGPEPSYCQLRQCLRLVLAPMPRRRLDALAHKVMSELTLRAAVQRIREARING